MSTDHRKLHFSTIDELQAEIDRIVAADQAGTLRCSGNWTAGQAFGHVAAWINYAYDGYPLRTPWFIRMILKRRVRKYLRDGMPRGVRIPKVRGGTYGIDPMTTQEGAARLRAALQRLGSEPARFESPAFGPLSASDHVALNIRHAELHLGYLHY